MPHGRRRLPHRNSRRSSGALRERDDRSSARCRLRNRHKCRPFRGRRICRPRHQRAVSANGSRADTRASLSRPISPTADLTSLGTFDTILVNSFLHHVQDEDVRADSEQLDDACSRLSGRVHILELVLPPHCRSARLMARLDRGRYARPIETLARAVRRGLRPGHFRAVHLRRRTLGHDLFSRPGPPVRLSRRHSDLQRAGSHSRAACHGCARCSTGFPAVRTKWCSSTMAARTTRRSMLEEAARERFAHQGGRAVEKLRTSGRDGRRARPRNRRCGRADGRRSPGSARNHPGIRSASLGRGRRGVCAAERRGRRAGCSRRRIARSIVSSRRSLIPSCRSTAAISRCSAPRS